MPPRITNVQRQAILQMLAQGIDRHTIAYQTGVTPGQVSAVTAHVKMGTYTLPSGANFPEAGNAMSRGPDPVREHAPENLPNRNSHSTARPTNLLKHLPQTVKGTTSDGGLQPVFLGTDAETGEDVYWNPDPQTGTANPHVLVLGESGFGKTYLISALLAELAQQQIVSMIFDYGQGFSNSAAPQEFLELAKPTEIEASQEGIAINPLEIFPSDMHGPLNVAQCVADTFMRVYPKLGVQQHAVLRQAVIDALADEGIVSDSKHTWTKTIPPFNIVECKLAQIAAGPQTPQSRVAASAASHISTVFVFNTFRQSGRRFAWGDMLRAGVFVIQLKGLEHSLERAVTEFLLWNLIGYVESLGPSPLRCFVVLDEAHRLSFDVGSPTEKLLREGRKFGLGLILASQQPQDFSPVAFGNTATKLVFQVADENAGVSRQIHKKLRNLHSFLEVCAGDYPAASRLGVFREREYRQGGAHRELR